MMNEKDKLTKESDGFKVVFERMYNHPIDRVWKAITDPAQMKYWFTDVEMDLKPGAEMIIRFRDEVRSKSYGEIVSVEPPNRFVWKWETELAEWDLEAMDTNRTRLVFTYSKMADQYAIGATTGFADLLDRLEAMLDGDKTIHPFGTEEFDPKHMAQKETFKKAILPKFPELEKYEPLVVKKEYKADIRRVWEAITDKDKMKQWYFDLDKFEPKVGFEFSFPGQGHEGRKYIHLCRITDVDPPHRLSYSWQYSDYEGESKVTFLLRETADGTEVTLVHSGIHTFPDHPDFARTSFNGGWTQLIGKLLKEFVER